MQEIAQNIEKREKLSSQDVAGKLKTGLLGHIEEMDSGLGRFLAENGGMKSYKALV